MMNENLLEECYMLAIIIISAVGFSPPKEASIGNKTKCQAVVTINKFAWVKTASGLNHDSLGRLETWPPVAGVSDSFAVCLRVSPLPSLALSIPICPIGAELIVGHGFLPDLTHGGFMPSGAWQRQQPQCHRPSPWPSFIFIGAQRSCSPP